MTRLGQMFEQEKLDYGARKELELLEKMIHNGTITLEQAANSLNCTIEEFQNLKKTLLKKV